MTEKDNTKKHLGDFEIIRELGRGGMGIVYEARQVSLNRKVALKVISSALGLSSKAVLRFRREAEAGGKLHHTNIVPIYATGEDQGLHYYAMELIEGPSLQQVIGNLRKEQGDDRAAAASRTDDGQSNSHRVGLSTVLKELPSWVAETFGGQVDSSSGPSPSSSSLTASDSSSSLQSGVHYFDTVARMIAEVADALDHAHEHGVIHRDIKPANLLLSPDGALSVNDFGLARMLEQPGMTMSGEFVGSPLYMSPEQITAGRVPLDHRTDIFSLGSTLYELLTLVPPFPGRGRDEVMARILQKEPRRPRSVNKKVPVDLETICLKALEKDPDQRYQTAGQLAEDLRRFMNRFEITAKRAGPVARAVKWARRRPAVAGLLACLVVAALAAGILARALSRAAEEARLAKGEAALQQAMVELFSGRFEEVEPHLERAEVHDVDPGRLRILRGAAARARGQTEEAIKELELATEQLPESLAAHALLTDAYGAAGRTAEYTRTLTKVQTLTPVTEEDYLYGAMYTYGARSRQTDWLRKVASERSSPVAEMLLGDRLQDNLRKTYNQDDVDEALERITVAKSMMRDNAFAAELYVVAHVVAADVHRVEENLAEHKDCLRRARTAAQEMLTNFPEHSAAYRANALLAGYEAEIRAPEGDWRKAAAHTARLGNAPFSYAVEFGAVRVLLYLNGETTAEEFEESGRILGRIFRSTFLLAERKEPSDAKEAIELWLSSEYPKPVVRRIRSQVFEAFSVLGQPREATESSKSYLERTGKPMGEMGEFYEVVDRYVCGEASAGELLAAAEKSSTRRRHRIHAHFLVGLERLSRGDRQEAVKHFEEIERAGSYLFSSRPWAAVLLTRLRDDPTWPPWIPVKDPADASRK